MKGFRVVASLSLAIGLVSVGSAGTRILPDFKSHLDSARMCFERGLYAQSNAHTQLVLIERIRIYVDGSTEQKRVVEEAANLWSDALNEDVLFTFVENKSAADVTISFDKSLVRHGVEAGGFAKWTRTVYGRDLSLARTTAQIELRTHAPQGKPMSSAEMRHCAAHELGHVLGLSDSTTAGDIMAPLVLGRATCAPKADEVAALRAIRDEASRLQMLSLNLELLPGGYHLLSEAA